MAAQVSVIILAYREPGFLNGLLASLAEQTLAPAEILVVDDASGEEYVRQYVLPAGARLLVNEKNAGVAAVSRNRALREAKGELVAFVDQDDRWMPEKLAIQAGALLARPEAVMHYTHLVRVDAELRLMGGQGVFVPLGRDALAGLLRRNSIAYSSVMVRREAFTRVGMFDEGIRAAADWDMWLRMAAAGGILGDGRPLLLRREHGGQWSKGALMMARGGEKVMAKAAAWVPGVRPDLAGLVRRRHGRWLRELARAELEAGAGRGEVMGILRRAVGLRPGDPRLYGLMMRAFLARRGGPA